jgi:tetratricopeptide (TPR) repeat protein/class 3 adenylate cyclase
MSIERKLAAIMFTDIAGFTKQMSKDEAVAISLLNKKESVLKPLIKEHNGTYVKSTGDGSLSHFNSAVDAAMCAKRLQESIYDDKDLNVRVGVHLGDTIFEKGDIRGDGVNIASRLESMAVEGGVFVSKEVHDQLANQKEFEGVALGLQSMKGVGRLIEVYGLKGDRLSEPNPTEYQDDKVAVHSDDEVPSIAIIPFENKGAEEDVFYAYGISADLISDCSGAGLIRVVGLKDIEKLDYANLKYEELSKKLLVRYIAQGTLWKMGEMFQLSVELYDTKDKKVVWSDRWQENWDNLPTIKGSLSDGLLKSLNTKPKVEKKRQAANTEAYEYYLKGKYKFEKREDLGDTEIARGLLRKAIESDDNLIKAKILLGTTYLQMGDYDKAMMIYTSTLKQAERLCNKHGMGSSLNSIGNVHYEKGDYDKALEYYEKPLKLAEEIGDKSGIAHNLHNIGVVYLRKGDIDTALDYYGRALAIDEELGDKSGMGYSLMNIGIVHHDKGDYDKALDYYGRALAIKEKLGSKRGIGNSLNIIGDVHANKGDYDKALDYYGRSLTIKEKLGSKRGMRDSLNNIGIVHYEKGDYDTALDYYGRALAINEELGDKRGIGYSLLGIGLVHNDKCDYDKAEKYLEKSLAIQKEIGLKEIELETTTYIYLTYKHLGKEYDVKEIHTLIKAAENIEFEVHYQLFKLLENKSYLESAYNQVQEKASAMDDGAKFLSYPIPKAIVEEWEKVK